MKNSTIHVSFAIGIALAPLSGFAAEERPVPNAVFQYLDEADFECSKEQPLRGIIGSPVVPLINWDEYSRVASSKKYVTERRGHDRRRIEIAPESADYTNRIEPKITEDAAFTIEYPAQVCVGILDTTVVGGTWSISGKSEKYDFSAKGNFAEPAVKISIQSRNASKRYITAANGSVGRKWFPRDVAVTIKFDELDVNAIEKTLFHRKFEERFTGGLVQSIGFQPDKVLSDDRTTQPNTLLPIRKE